MRSWFASSALVLSSTLCLLLMAPAPVHARGAGDGLACLRAANLTCAQKIRDQLNSRAPDDADTLRLAAKTAFHEGDYDGALQIWQKLEERGLADDPYTPYAATAAAATGLVEATAEGVMLRHDSGVDTILADEALELSLIHI